MAKVAELLDWLVQADAASICSHILHDSVALANSECLFGRAAVVFKCFTDHGKSLALAGGLSAEAYSQELAKACEHDRQVALRAVLLDPRWRGETVGFLACKPSWPRTDWDVPIGNTGLRRIFRFCMGSLALPIKGGRHINLPRTRRICRWCRAGASGDERHMLLEWTALEYLQKQYSSLISGVTARLMWPREQPLVSIYIIACRDRMSC